MITPNNERNFDRIIKRVIPYLILFPLDDKDDLRFKEKLKNLFIAYINGNAHDLLTCYVDVEKGLSTIEKKYNDKNKHILEKIENDILKKYDEQFLKKYSKFIKQKRKTRLND